MQQNPTTRTAQASLAGALAAAHAEASANRFSGVRFPGSEGGSSLAEMAERDLDAALQLLAHRAQYITGASGAAIALRRDGKNDMLCRASAGANAPELGALLSTEFGLSGESVRTRQALRCDDAERDGRVNRDVCRRLGIASVMVMPVENDEGVLGVLELFSGKANAFGTRDLSAVQRLSEMVEVAVRLAHATESLTERLRTSEISVPVLVAEDERLAADQVLDDEIVEGEVLGDLVLEDSVLEEPPPVAGAAAEPRAERPGLNGAGVEALTERAVPEVLSHHNQASSGEVEAAESPKQIVAEKGVAAPELAKAIGAAAVAAVPRVPPQGVASPFAEAVPPKNRLFWSAVLNPAADAGKPEEQDQSHVPPVLRSLRKCEACGFPVSASRVLCVECEEKKWRGQLRVPPAGPPRPGVLLEKAVLGPPAAKAPTENQGSIAALEAQRHPNSGVAASAKTGVGTAAAVAPALAAASVALPSKTAGVAPGNSTSSVAVQTSPGMRPEAPAIADVAPPPQAPMRETESEPPAQAAADAAPEFVLSAGLEPSQSWLSANKYIVGVLLLVAGVVVTVFLMR
ncbi:MAG: GAF domain-containing protein [Candidatus Sulfotelmatobacter sp.]